VSRDSEQRSGAQAFDDQAFRRLAELAADALIAHDGDRILWANSAAAALLGVSSAAAMVGTPILRVLAPESVPIVSARIRRMLVTGRPEPPIQTTYLHSDGQRLPVDVAVSTIGDGVVLVAVRDLRPRVEADRERRSAEARARAFFDASTEAMGISRLGVHVEVNAAYARLFGYDAPGELVGVPILELLDPSEHERIVEKIRRRVRGEQESPSFTARAKRRDGSPFLLDVRTSAYLERDVPITVVVMRDVTAQRELDEQLRHVEKLEAIGRLAGGVAHDFNNLLAAILGHAEVSREHAQPGSVLHDSLTGIREASLRARDLVRQILTFGRKDQPNRRPHDLSAIVADALGLARAAIPATVTLEVSVAPRVGTVVADRTQLHQIVLNLCANANDAAGPSGHIFVTLERLPPSEGSPLIVGALQARLRVRDDGVGMDESTRARLFEPYMTTKAHAGGHGLGLAVVHGIVSGIGGAVVVESAPGQGARFDVYFPLVETPAVSTQRPAPVSGGTERVLLVEDDPLVRAALRRVLQSLGYQVTQATDGLDALAQVRATPGAFDVIISDQTMPHLSGLEFARTLLAEQPEARILLCTGFSDALDEPSVRALGVKELLAKPLERAVLAAALRRALE
jgi:PAS domain S-box-containing protein